MAETTYRKKDIIGEVAKANGKLSKKAVNEVCNSFLRQIKEELTRGNTVVISGFGKFYSSISKRQTGRDINREKPVTFPKKRVVHFKASTTLRKAVREEK